MSFEPKQNADGEERRSSARLAKSVRLSIQSDKEGVEAEVINISMSGLLCRLPQNVPLMTKIEMKLFLPSLSSETKNTPVTIRGVVVRSDKREKEYLVAIFFSDLSSAATTQLSFYLNDDAEPDVDQLR